MSSPSSLESPVFLNAGATANVSLRMVGAAHRMCGVAWATTVALVLSVPAFAQTNTRSSAMVVRQYVPAAHVDTEHSSPPENLVVTAALRPVVALMLRRSHTFRRQCQRIANAPQISVALQRASSPLPRGVRARTQMVRSANGKLVAVVEVPALDDDVELIAHEVEHVIEQLDEVDLATAAKRSNSGVVVAAQDRLVFETRRATWVGLLVAREVRRTER